MHNTYDITYSFNLRFFWLALRPIKQKTKWSSRGRKADKRIIYSKIFISHWAANLKDCSCLFSTLDLALSMFYKKRIFTFKARLIGEYRK